MKRRPPAILVVDDYDDAAAMLAMALHAVMGGDVRSAHGGAAALAMAAATVFDAGVLDVNMPEVDGIEVARGMRARAGTGRLVLVAVTGHPESLVRAEQSGLFDHVVVKPVSIGRLVPLLSGGATPR
jgi:CheY-like chemotaxis protein